MPEGLRCARDVEVEFCAFWVWRFLCVAVHRVADAPRLWSKMRNANDWDGS